MVADLFLSELPPVPTVPAPNNMTPQKTKVYATGERGASVGDCVGGGAHGAGGRTGKTGTGDILLLSMLEVPPKPTLVTSANTTDTTTTATTADPSTFIMDVSTAAASLIAMRNAKIGKSESHKLFTSLYRNGYDVYSRRGSLTGDGWPSRPARRRSSLDLPRTQVHPEQPSLGGGKTRYRAASFLVDPRRVANAQAQSQIVGAPQDLALSEEASDMDGLVSLSPSAGTAATRASHATAATRCTSGTNSFGSSGSTTPNHEAVVPSASRPLSASSSRQSLHAMSMEASPFPIDFVRNGAAVLDAMAAAQLPYGGMSHRMANVEGALSLPHHGVIRPRSRKPGRKMEDKRCVGCKTQDTPYWREGWEPGLDLCNACGLRYKKHDLHCSQCGRIPLKKEVSAARCGVCHAIDPFV